MTKRAQEVGVSGLDYIYTCELFLRTENCEHKMRILSCSKVRDWVNILCLRYLRSVTRKDDYSDMVGKSLAPLTGDSCSV